MTTEPSNKSPSKRPIHRTLLFVSLLVVGLLALLELGSRAYWTFVRGVGPTSMIHAFYPELDSIRTGDDAFDVLLLGGSVLEYASESLELALLDARPRPLRLHTAARESHSTRDSLIKYRALADESFDLVVIYHGINEVRANNIAPEDYRDDYTHYAWYGYLEALDAHPERPFLAFPYTLHYLGLTLAHRLGATAEIPIAGPPPEMRRHGAEIKTERAFRSNLDDVLETAKQRDEPVLLMSFAWYVPDDYSVSRFASRELDYDADELGLPIEIWGDPEHVIAGVVAHNAVIAELAGSHDEVIYLDQRSLTPDDGRLYGDICHFTETGTDLFVANIVSALRMELPEFTEAAAKDQK